jgi:plastocyanin
VVIDAGSSPSPDREVQVNPTKIKVGDTVRWENQDSDPHTVTSGINGQPDGKFNSGEIESFMMSGAEPFVHTFTEPGEYPYFCSLHPDKARTVIVS